MELLQKNSQQIPFNGSFIHIPLPYSPIHCRCSCRRGRRPYRGQRHRGPLRLQPKGESGQSLSVPLCLSLSLSVSLSLSLSVSLCLSLSLSVSLSVSLCLSLSLWCYL